MQRLRRLAVPLALIAALATAGILVGESAADLENLVFTSRAGVRLIVPRGWRASDQTSYPGVLLWMARTGPAGQIELTAERFNHDLYCSWSVPCRTSHDPLAARYACALRSQLEARHVRVGPTQAGPRENEAAGLTSVWFEYDDGKHFVRHAIALEAEADRQPSSDDRVFSLVLSAPSPDARATHTRAFDQALRTLQLLSPEETARVAGIDAAPPASGDAAPGDAGLDAGLIDGAVLDAGVVFESAPAPAINPIGPCDKK